MRLIRLATCVAEGDALALRTTIEKQVRPIDWLMRDEDTGETLRFKQQPDGFTFVLERSLTVLDAAKAGA